jgi:hypothetical protein
MYRLKILIGALLVSMLALGGVVTAATTSSTNVTASVTESISVEAPAAVSSWDLAIGDNEKSGGNLTVATNRAQSGNGWSVTVSGTNSGKLYNSANSVALTNALSVDASTYSVSGDTGANAGLGATAAPLLTTFHKFGTSTIPITFRQNVVATDPAYTYTQTVTFSASLVV